MYHQTKRLSFTHEATLRKRSFVNEHLSDHMVWSLFPDEYPSTPSAELEGAAYAAAERRKL